MNVKLRISCFIFPDNIRAGSESDSTISSEVDGAGAVVSGVEVCQEEHNLEMKLLDLYSGCGAMSTGLCLGANSTGVKLVTVRALIFPSTFY